MSEFPSEYAKPMSPMKPVLWLWFGVFVMCGFCLIVPLDCASKPTWGRETGCISNQKQIMMSVAIYMSDNEDYLPPYYSFDSVDKLAMFTRVLQPYLKNDQIFLCPYELRNIEQNRPSVRSSEGIPGKMDFTHFLSFLPLIPDYAKGKRLLSAAAVTDPSKARYLRDVVRGFSSVEGPHFTSSHSKAFIVSFLDTHVKTNTLKSPSEL